MVKRGFFEHHGFVKKDDLVFDVGCITGKFTSQFLKIGAQVVCVEANPVNANQMRKIYGDRITLVEAALTNRVGTVQLYYNSTKHHHATLNPETYVKQRRRTLDVFDRYLVVPGVTIDSLAVQYGTPAFVKLDIEAGEYAALQGMSHPVPALSFEFAFGYIEEMYKCTALLHRLGYEFNYVEAHHGELLAKDWIRAERFTPDIPPVNEKGKQTWGNVYARLAR